MRLAALAAVLVLGALTTQPAFAATRAGSPTPGDLSRQLSTLQRQLQQQLATINSLTDQEDTEQASVDALDSKVSADQQREQALNRQLDRVARIEYERPALSLITVLDARNVGQLLSGMAQDRVISQQQQQLLDSARALRASDQRDQAAARAQLDKISKQQAQATAIAAKTRAEISTLQAEEKAAEQRAAQRQAAQRAAQQRAATAPSSTNGPAPAAATGSVPAIIEAAFAPLGATAQQWGLCIAQHESGDNPSAVQVGGGGAEGLFQFEPSTWATTPEGEAGDSIFDATASAEAAAWEYSRGNYSAWTTNADFCSMYD